MTLAGSCGGIRRRMLLIILALVSLTAAGRLVVMAALALAHGAAYWIDFARLSGRIGDALFACGYGMTVAAILPFVNVKIVPFIYFQF